MLPFIGWADFGRLFTMQQVALFVFKAFNDLMDGPAPTAPDDADW